MQRRVFISRLIRSAVIISLVPAGAMARELSLTGSQHGKMARLCSLINCNEAAGLLGMAYMREFPIESSGEVLLSLLCRSMKLDSEELAHIEQTSLRARLSIMQKTDYEDENVVKTNGWILSRNEARIYALCALSVNNFS
jgi:hypothetical protein